MHQIACSRWMVVVGLVLFTIWLSALAVGLLAIYVADEYVTLVLQRAERAAAAALLSLQCVLPSHRGYCWAAALLPSSV